MGSGGVSGVRLRACGLARRPLPPSPPYLWAVARYALNSSKLKREDASVYSTWLAMERWMVCTSAGVAAAGGEAG